MALVELIGTEALYIIALAIIFIVQLLLSFTNSFIKALPTLILLIATATFAVLTYTSQSWDALGYALLMIACGGGFLCCCVAWVISFIVKRFI